MRISCYQQHFVRAAAVVALLATMAVTARALTLDISRVSGAVGDRVSVSVSLQTVASEPATLQGVLAFDPAKLSLATVTPGSATVKANKSVSSAISATNDELRFVVTGFSTTAAGYSTVLEDGPLFSIDFIVTGGTPGETLAVVASTATAATPVADAIPVVVAAGGVDVIEQIHPPDNLDASTDRTDGVLISWDAVSGESITYTVYRSESNVFATAQPLFDTAIRATSYLDTTASEPATTAGCPGGGQSPVIYYYWVTARNTAGSESDPAGPVTGYRLAGSASAAMMAWALATAVLLAAGLSSRSPLQ